MPKGLSIEPNPFKERENASGQLVTAFPRLLIVWPERATFFNQSESVVKNSLAHFDAQSKATLHSREAPTSLYS